MHRLFGKPGPPKAAAPTINDASGSIGTRLTDIDGKIKALDDEMRRYKTALKQNPNNANIKKRAMDCLKRKRMYEQQRDQFANQQLNLDQTQFAIETVKNTQESVAAMKVASKVLKKETKKLSLSEIEDMQDDMEDMLEDVGGLWTTWRTI
jgi:charged multivesicular body protein 5